MALVLTTPAQVDQYLSGRPASALASLREDVGDFYASGSDAKEIAELIRPWAIEPDVDVTTEVLSRWVRSQLRLLITVTPVVEDEGLVLISLETRPNALRPGDVVSRWLVPVGYEPRIDALQLRELRRPDRYVIVHRATKPGALLWQATWFDDAGAGGDIQEKTLERAMNEAARAHDYALEEVKLVSQRRPTITNPRRRNPGVPTLRPTASTPSEAGYLYHVTSLDRAFDIAAGGLETHRPDWGTEQDVWPDGSTEKRSYWTPKASSAWQFAPEGEPVLLRALATELKAKAERGTGDYVVTRKVPASVLQILTESGWSPLVQWVETPRENPPRTPRQSAADKAAAAAVDDYVRRWSRLGIRPEPPTLVSEESAGGFHVFHINRHGQAIGGTELRLRDSIASFSSQTEARRAIDAALAARFPRPNPTMTKQQYLDTLASIPRWIRTGIGGGHLSRFIPAAARPAIGGGAGVDYEFWTGEVLGNLRHALEHDSGLSEADRAQLLVAVDQLSTRPGRLAELSQHALVPRRNPAGEPAKAIRMFRRFHTRDWRGEGDFHPDLAIPDHVVCLGDAVNTDYRSDKLNPTDGDDEGWIDYTHEHDAGVKVYQPPRGANGAVRVPAWIRNVDQLTWLGKCLGFRYRDDNGVHEAKGTEPLPELYAIPSGKALLVIQGKRSILAILWGGHLAVERRGIVH